MKCIAICSQGLEDITQIELKEILKAASKIVAPGRVSFSTTNVQKLITKTQSVIKVYELKQQCSTVEEIETFPIVAPFRVVCSKRGGFPLGSQDVERVVGEKFFQQGNAVDLEKPKTIVFVDMIDDSILVGVDLTPALLSKRDYRIKIHNQSINACIAYGLVRLSGYKKGETLLDPFAKDGVIVIEAARYQKGKILAYDSLFPNVRNVEINAKLAGVRKEITVGRIDVEWLDTKFEEREVDCVVSAVPFPSKSVAEKDVKKIYKELFYHLEYVMSKKGKVVLIAPTVDLLLQMVEHFRVIERRTVATSSLFYHVVVLQK